MKDIYKELIKSINTTVDNTQTLGATDIATGILKDIPELRKLFAIPVVIESVCDYCEKPIDLEKDSIVCGACREKIGF